ncbi:6-carboxytetrahydropterin synthase [Pseudacidobacterium ailaaui]|jgi:6-pyruvoyltetrahydropterin/6-carboxytetrahydropterin synthase|uniref:6-carboxytetrahydropterin synthase n=1 Tax=Pseudacidobacterium ailaaui TaxID=1382359 RepID=UPI00047AEF30|nr:6-carboxytetrahydropterin synthase [Pseudacidobacterium ailaaui]MBX6358752.1 6-carboxytetrahydropterin synthase [Pseudacidobacterium ailaaui]MCL6464224.1 6-carboxytetrahydropterin synthase [Pseudacidobacterium ailaaui]MDI3253964.1 6-carboxytetrahydropterin synthase [Bacillota bacterium]
MRAYFSRRYRISASHRLHSEAFSREKNRELYGKCNNPHGHGHNYVIEVTVGGPVDPETGMVCNLVDLDECVRKEVLERFDHTNLNLDPLFAERVPTTENLCIEIYRMLSSAFDHGEIVRVRIEETSNNFFEYPAV